ncbi:MAG: Uma2 family endonuclease [Lewinellaceae bacterium]|nr:Uma2 family endonuclease [Lewinellaceae bacterium]
MSVKIFSKDQVIFPAPDFITEIISPSTAAKGRGVKKQDYAAHVISEWPGSPLLKKCYIYKK